MRPSPARPVDVDGELCAAAKRAIVRIGVLRRLWLDESMQIEGMTAVLCTAEEIGDASPGAVGFAAALAGEVGHGDPESIGRVLCAGHRAFDDAELVAGTSAIVRALTIEVARLLDLDVDHADRVLTNGAASLVGDGRPSRCRLHLAARSA